MSKIRLHGSSSGYTEIAPVAASGNNTLTLPNDGTIISKDSNGAVGVTSITVGTGVTIGDGRVTCTTLHGSGANITGISSAATSDFVKLTSVTDTSEVSDFTFDSLDTTTYQAFKLVLSMSPSDESSTSIRFRWRSSGSALTADEYNWANLGVSGAGTYYDNAGEDTSGLFTYSGWQQTGEGYRMIDATIIPKTSGDFQQSRNSYYVIAQRYDSSASHRGETNYGTYNVNVNPDGFMIYPTTGNFKNYSYVLYGLKR